MYPHAGRMRRRTRIWLGATLLACGAAAGAPPPPGLDPDPLVAVAIGLRMHLPAGAVTVPQAGGGQLSYAVSGPEPTTWSMRIAALSPAAANPTAAALAAERFDTIKVTGRPYRVITNQVWGSGGSPTAPGHLLCVEQTLDNQTRIVNGWLILPTSPRTFVDFAFLTTAEHFPGLRRILDESFSTIELRTQAQLADERQAALERGRALAERLTPQVLRGAVSSRRWYRIYRPGSTGSVDGDTEVGFLSLRCEEAPRGQLTLERSPDSFGSLEAKLGLMVMIEARAIIDITRGHYFDVDGRYWMDWDRSTEAWSVRQTQRLGESSQTTAETGVRNLATLDVIHSLKEQVTREPARWSIPDTAYLSQPEVFLLGRLLPRDGSIDGPLAFSYYDTRTRRLTQRLDSWTPAGDGTGQWILTTQPILEVATITQRFDATGERLRRIDADGTITDRLDPEDLRRLWRSKGLLAR